MTNFEGDNIDFSDLNLGGIESLEEHIESADEVAAPIKPEVEPSADEAEEEVVAAEPKEQRSKQSFYIELAVAIGVPVILLAIAGLHLLYVSTAIYLIAVGFVPYGLWKGRETSTIYTVVLGCALIAVMTAIYFMWVEFGRYEFDVKARDGKRRAGVSQTIPAGFCSHQQILRNQSSFLPKV